MDGVVVRLEKMLCKIKPKYGSLVCKIKPKSRNDASMSVNVTLIRKLTAMTYHCTGYYQFSNNEYRPMILNVKTDFCAAQSGLLDSLYQNVFTHIWRNKTNIFQNCPIPPGYYYLKDWNFVAADLPNIIPAGRYLVVTDFFANSDELAASTSTYFRVENHGILDMNVG